VHGQLSPRRFGHNLGTNEHGFRILLIRKPDIWCGEGDLPPTNLRLPTPQTTAAGEQADADPASARAFRRNRPAPDGPRRRF